MHEVVNEAEYMNEVQKIIKWAKTSITTLESDDEAITEQIAETARFNARIIQDELEVANALELLEATKRVAYRKEKATLGEKITEKFLDDLVTLDSEVQEMRQTHRNMQRRVHVVEGLLTAISVSKRMFIERNKQKLNHIYAGE